MYPATVEIDIIKTRRLQKWGDVRAFRYRPVKMGPKTLFLRPKLAFRENSPRRH